MRRPRSKSMKELTVSSNDKPFQHCGLCLIFGRHACNQYSFPIVCHILKGCQQHFRITNCRVGVLYLPLSRRNWCDWNHFKWTTWIENSIRASRWNAKHLLKLLNRYKLSNFIQKMAWIVIAVSAECGQINAREGLINLANPHLSPFALCCALHLVHLLMYMNDENSALRNRMTKWAYTFPFANQNWEIFPSATMHDNPLCHFIIIIIYSDKWERV